MSTSATLSVGHCVEPHIPRLSRDLYNTKTHFLLEFIQNADDNEYEPHVVPNLQLRLHGRELVIRCNEKGFRAENVRAICDVRRSTKTKGPGKESCIGEKGIGMLSDES